LKSLRAHLKSFKFILLSLSLALILSCQTSRQKQDIPVVSSPSSPQPKEFKIQPDQSMQWFQAARKGDMGTLQKLHGDLNVPWDYSSKVGVTALMMASRYGKRELIEFLLNQNVNINLVDLYGYNALSYAVYGPLPLSEKKTIAAFLIEKQADPFQEDHIQTRPVLFLIENGLLDLLGKITWSVHEDCDQKKRFSTDFSLIKHAANNDQPEVAEFFKSIHCP
jgi:ankyrin repeat protein